MHHSFNRFPEGKSTLLVALMSLGMLNITSAQTLVTPSLSDNTWYTSSSNPIVHIETAMISFGNAHTIMAVNDHEIGPGATDYINVMDDLGNTATIASTSPVSAVTSLDIAIGNWDGVSTGCASCTSVQTDFILATAFRNTSGQVEIDYYDVYDDGVSTLTINPLAALTSTTNLSSYNANVTHLDLIAEYGNTGITGLPFCNKFAVTWEDGPTNNVYADTTTLNNPRATLTGTQMNSGTGGAMPDVSYIQRRGFTPPHPIHDIALVTYVNAAEVYLVTWDCTANTISSPTTLDNGSTSAAAAQPRIDALDDFNHNSAVTNSNYKVVAEINNGTYPEVRSYDNVLGAGSYYTSSSVIDISGAPGYSAYTPPYLAYMGPVVALGPNLNYVIMHSMMFANDSDIIFMEPIKRSAPTALVGNDYYWVNTDGAPLYAIYGLGSTFVVSVSEPVNNPGLANLYAWEHQTATGYEVDYKTTAGVFAFKQSPNFVATTEQKSWSAYPNPATTELTISNPVSTGATSYHIMDMIGRVVLQGELSGTVQKIDIGSLAQGDYILGLYENGLTNNTTVFAKK